MARTKLNVPVQVDVRDDVNFNGKKIKNISAPAEPTDAANKAYVDAQITSGVLGIGLSEDASYQDGLFTDFTPDTTIGVAVDRFNEVLKSLAPQPAPNLTSASFTSSGVSGKLSFGASNAIADYTNVPGVDINGLYSIGGNRKGIFNSTTTVTGTLADNVVPNFANSRPYPNYSFGDGNLGSLHLIVNGVTVHSVDLSTFSSGSSMTSSSGFTLSAATNVKFTNGDDFNVFKYRTGTWSVAPSVQRKGYNTVQIRHEYSAGMFRDTQTFDFVVDDSVATTTYSGISFDSLTMTGSNAISGVTYHTAGSAKYDVVIENAYKNTYSSGASPISFIGTNCSATAQAIPTTTSQSQTITLTDIPVTISTGARLLNANISLSTAVDRTINSNEANSSSNTISGLLLDATAPTSTATSETFDDEGYRIHTGLSLTDTTYGSARQTSNATWVGSNSLIGANQDHNTGLLVSNGRLTYPKVTSHISGITNGNFSSVVNGATNPNYSTATGSRTFLRYFYTSTAKSNFRLNVTGSGITFVSVATGPSANNLTMEVLAPNTTKDAGGSVVWKDAVVAHSGSDVDVGCYAGTYGSSIPTNWGITLGAKNTSTSGGAVLIRITASENWTGSIDSITLTWL